MSNGQSGRHAVLPIAVDELIRSGVDTTGVPEDTTYAAIFSSPYDMKRGLKRWIDTGCTDPFSFSTSYSHIYQECGRLKDSHEKVASDLKEVCIERAAMKQELADIKNDLDQSVLDNKEADNQNSMNGYRVESLTEMVDELEDKNRTLEVQLKAEGENLAVAQSDAERFESEGKTMSVKFSEQSERLKEFEEWNDQASKSNGRMLKRLEGTAWRRFICTIFGI